MRIRDPAAQIVVDFFPPQLSPARRLEAIKAIRGLVEAKDERIAILAQALERCRIYAKDMDDAILRAVVGGERV